MRNTVTARAKATIALRRHLIEQRQLYPKAHHAIVAHSHGGNVALTALADEELATSTLGVATLGTPFLSARVVSREPLLDDVDAFVAATFSGIAVFAVGAALGHGRKWWLPALLTMLAIGAVLILTANVVRLMRAHAKRVSELMPATKLEPAQLLVVRTSADEAAAVLSGARVAGICAALFWNVLTSRVANGLSDLLRSVDYFGSRAITMRFADARAERAVRLFGSASPSAWQNSWSSWTPSPTTNWRQDLGKTARETVLPQLPPVVLSLLDSASAAARWAGAVIAVAYGVPAILALLITVASVPFSMLLALGLLPSGWSLPLAGAYLDVTAEPTPPGTWSVTQLRTDVAGESLSHGNAHDDRGAIAAVTDWLARRAAEVEQRQAAIR